MTTCWRGGHERRRVGPRRNSLASDGGRSDAAHPDVSLEIDLDGVEIKSVITPQDFLPGGSSDWARLRFAGLERGKELVVGKMVGVVKSAEERIPSIEGGWRGKARSIIWLHGSFEMTARLDADELTRAFDRDPKLANAQGWASEQARYPGLVKYKPSSHWPSPGTRLELSTRAQRSSNSISTSAFGRPARSRHRGARTNG